MYNRARNENFLGNTRTLLFWINQAHMQYLQDEYASILVNSHFDSTTSKLFRAMKKNTFGLNASSLETIQSAASLSAAVKSPPTRQCSGFSNRGYYRGGSRGYITTWPDRTRSIISSADSSLSREERATVHRSKTHWMWLQMRYVIMRKDFNVWVLWVEFQTNGTAQATFLFFHNPILSYRLSMLSYRVCILFYPALIISHHA